MIFTAKIEDLKRAFTMASFAIGDSPEKISSHALFTITENKCLVQACDDDSFSYTSIPVEGIEGTSEFKDIRFTVSPKNMLKIVGDSDRKDVRFNYDSKTKTLQVFVSEDDDAFLSMPSFDPDEFLPFEDLIKPALSIAEVDAAVFTTALKFQQGFASKDEKNPKFSNVYIKEGVFHSSNGTTWVGAFKCDEFGKIYSLIIRHPMISPILNMMEKLSLDTVNIRESEKIVLICSPEGLSGFGFRKSAVQIPNIPFITTKPDGNGISIDKGVFIKKISRLSMVIKNDRPGILVTVTDDTMTMKTRSDRPSTEKMSCRRISGTEPLQFLVDESMIKNLIPLFQVLSIDLYIMKNRCVVYSTGDLLIGEDNPVKKPFTATALLSLPRES